LQAAVREKAGVHRCRHRRQVGRAGERNVQWFKSLGGGQQQRRRLALSA